MNSERGANNSMNCSGTWPKSTADETLLTVGAPSVKRCNHVQMECRAAVRGFAVKCGQASQYLGGHLNWHDGGLSG